MQTIEEVRNFFKQRDKLGIKLGLERIKSLLRYLDHPENSTKMIHVAGTNGKGSTIQLMKDASVANGYKVGLFTSPSFHDLNGHFFINNRMIGDKQLVELLNITMPGIEALDTRGDAPTAFEIITVLAFLYFKQAAVDFAFIETGMGGKEDTTNCFLPFLSIITNVEKDHMQFLGNTLSEITSHKAGIIKENRPIITGPLHEESKILIKARSAALSAPLYMYAEQFYVKDNPPLSTWVYGEKEVPFTLNLLGSHQIENAAVALMGLHIMVEEGIVLDWKKVLESFRHAKIEGRLEKVQSQPTIILDSAHNSAAMSRVVKTMKTSYPNKKIYVLFAGFHDKPIKEMVDLLSQLSPHITITTFEHERAASIEETKDLLKNKHLHYVKNWQLYVEKMKKDNDDKVLFVTGSLHFITQVRQWLKKM